MRYCFGKTDARGSYALRDPREVEIAGIVSAASGDPEVIVEGLFALANFFPDDLLAETPRATAWRREVTDIVLMMCNSGMRFAITEEARLMAF